MSGEKKRKSEGSPNEIELRDELNTVRSLRRTEAELLKTQIVKVGDLEGELKQLKEKLSRRDKDIITLNATLKESNKQLKSTHLKLDKAIAQRTMVASGLEEKNMTVKQLKQKLSSKEQEIESKDISIEEKTKLYINAQVLFKVERKERKRLEALGVGQSDDGGEFGRKKLSLFMRDHSISNA